MKFLSFILFGLLCGVSSAGNLAEHLGTGNVVTTSRVRAELMAYAPEGVQAGKPLWLGLQLQHQPGWHTYWKNPGDSGLPTQLNWTLPAGVVAGEMAWPTPKKIPVANLANYGYEGTVLLPVPVTVTSSFQAAGADITVLLKAHWLVCKTECIPEEGEFNLKLPVQGSTALARPLFDAAQLNQPKAHVGKASFTPQGQALKLTVAGLPSTWVGKQLEAFAESGEIIVTAAKPQQIWAGEQWTAMIPLSAQRSTSPEKLAWVIKVAGGQNNPAIRAEALLDGAWPPPPAVKPEPISPALDAALAGNTEKHLARMAAQTSWLSVTFWLAVVGALLGGLILNLMPCVLPVLAIKLLSFTPQKIKNSSASVASVLIEPTGVAKVHSDDTLSFRWSSGLFAVGVIASFVLLGGALLLLRGAGQSLGWGFQLQSPAMVASLAVLFLLVGLNLFEAFELRIVLPQPLMDFQSKHPGIEAVASGVLAVLIATPCTAPFMGASLGLAIALPAAQALLIFAALGVGMALPFLLIAAYPRVGGWLLQVLPKPGRWMQVMRDFLAWPVFATVVWLLWVYAQQAGINSAFALVSVLLMLTALIWAIDLPQGWPRRIVASIFALCLVVACWLWHSADEPAAPVLAAPQATTSTSSVWASWTPEAEAAARAEGRPVFVDFTAAWCLTCQVNKSSTLNSADIESAFKAKNVRLFRADWTRPNATIAAELVKLGRSGLPVYALYRPNESAPQLLPEVLTKKIILDALAGL
jgi:thiol:disulfide interchange protein/DsbC/DsbD-like thiol-disulfide interchange protein